MTKKLFLYLIDFPPGRALESLFYCRLTFSWAFSVVGSKRSAGDDDPLGEVPAVAKWVHLFKCTRENRIQDNPWRSGRSISTHSILLIVAKHDMVLPRLLLWGVVEVMLVQPFKEPRVRRRLILLRPLPLPATFHYTLGLNGEFVRRSWRNLWISDVLRMWDWFFALFSHFFLLP